MLFLSSRIARVGSRIDFLARKILASVASYVEGSQDDVINHYQLVQLYSNLEYSVGLEAFSTTGAKC